jgi:chromosome segregation ATPase
MNIFKSRISESEQSLIKLQEEYDSLNTLFDEAKTNLVNMTESHATVSSELARVSEENKALLERVQDLKAEVAEVAKDSANFNTEVAEKAIDLIASIGVPPVDNVEVETETLDVMATLKTLKGKELTEFYTQHKTEIFHSLKH